MLRSSTTAKIISFITLATTGMVLLALPAGARTPELGKEKLRRLLKLPAITFPANWSFDPEYGFTVGSSDQDRKSRIEELRKKMREDSRDAELYLELGNLYAGIQDSANAAGAWSKSERLYRQRVEAEPGDPVLLAGFGEALEGAGKREEAESVLRRAVALGTNQWQGWLAMGKFLDEESRRDLSERDPGANGALDPDRVARARRRLEEAAGCFEQAVARAPDESEAHLRRALHRTLEGYLLNSIGQASGEGKPDSEAVREFFPLESLADLKRASRLEPKDYSLAGNAALYEIYCVNAQRGRRGLGEGFDWTTLPDATQRSLRETIARLENLAEDPDPKAASGALEVLGTLEGPVLRQTSRSVDTLQRALALDPARQRAWEILAGTLARTGRYDDLLAVCADHLRQENSSRAHILLAKAYERLKQYDDAEEEVLEAIKLSDSDASATLSLAVLLLKRAQDEDTLGDADGWLSRCAQLLSATPPAQRNRQLIIDYTLTRGIYYALADDFDAARQWVQTVLQSDPGNESAKEVLSALAY